METQFEEIFPESPQTDDLFAILYSELRKIAARRMSTERRSHTMQATALVHETFLRLARSRLDCSEKGPLLALAATAMRHVLVDHARARLATKRDSAPHEDLLRGVAEPRSFLDLHRALDRLAKLDSRQARIVELRFFGGCTEEETAQVLGISVRTVKRDWTLARVWLYGELSR